MTPPPAERLRRAVGRTGLNRGFLIRRMVRLGSPKLRELHLKAGTPGPAGWALGVFTRWMARGAFTVPQGLGGGLRLDLKGIPLSHAHIGSLAFGNLEQSVQEAMLRHLRKGDVFYDIGANVGFFTVLAAYMVGIEEGRAYAFEPTPDNAEEIRSNARLNLATNLAVIEKAVSDKAGTGQLQVVDDQSWSKLIDYGEHPLTEQVMDVELVAIDDLVASGEIEPPDVVKIDVEGAELAVLEGMRKTLAEHAPVIICELHDTHKEFAAFCREVDYRVVNLEGAYSIEEAGASAHALALPPGHLGE
jgi:FkbM family methyltransferase